MKFSEILIMNTTNNGLFVYQLKKQLKLVFFVRKPLLGEQRWATPLAWKMYHFRNSRTETIHTYKKIHCLNAFLELKADSKLSTFFIHSVYIYIYIYLYIYTVPITSFWTLFFGCTKNSHNYFKTQPK